MDGPDVEANTARAIAYCLAHPQWRLGDQTHKRVGVDEAERTAADSEAAHRLPNVPQTHRCYRMHGHSYRIAVELEGAVDPLSGFVADFFDVETVVSPVLVQLDHYCLNEIDGLQNPTAENIAVWIWDRLKAGLPQLARIVVYETPQCWVEYDGD